MKTYTYVVVLLLLIFSTSKIFSQQLSNEEQAREYRVKAMKFDNMKMRGMKMMIGGTLLFGGGIYALATAEYVTDIYGNVTTTDPKYLLGLAGVYLGIPVMAGGVIFYVIGRKKFDQYSEKARKITLEAGITPHGAGFTIRF